MSHFVKLNEDTVKANLSSSKVASKARYVAGRLLFPKGVYVWGKTDRACLPFAVQIEPNRITKISKRYCAGPMMVSYLTPETVSKAT